MDMETVVYTDTKAKRTSITQSDVVMKSIKELKKDNIISDDLSPEEQVIQVKNYYEGIIRKMPGNIYWKNKDSVVLGCNDNMAQHYDLDIKDIVGKRDIDIMGPNCGKFIHENDKEIYTTGQEMTFEESALVNGQTHYVLSRKVPMFNDHNEIVGLVGVSLDITEQKKREELQRQQVEALERIKLLKGLAASIAHELRTPLATIRAGINVANHYYPKLIKGYRTATAAHLVESPLHAQKLHLLDEAFTAISRQVENCNAIIDTLLQNISVDEITPTPAPHKYSLQEIIQNAVHEYPLTQQEKTLVHINLISDIETSIKPLQLKQIIWNLMKNALYFIQDARKGEIYISSQINNNGRYELLFKDTGKGISPENMEHIFKQFYTTRVNGTGLGLYFCRLVMNSLGGNLRCESEPGEYTTFILELP